MNKFFDAFNELPKPRILKNLPPMETFKNIAPQIPGLVTQFFDNKHKVFEGGLPLSAGKKKGLTIAVIIIETIFNKHIYQQKALSSATEKLQGKSLAIFIEEIGHNVTLVFNSTGVDILIDAEYKADCALKTSIKTLKLLKDKSLLTELIKTEKLNVHGDITVLQEVNQLLDKIEHGIGALLSPLIGDLAASLVESLLKRIFLLFNEKAKFVKSCLESIKS